MQTHSLPTNDTHEADDRSDNPAGISSLDVKIGLLTGCQDRPYVFGLAMALASRNVSLDVVGNEEVDGPEMHITPNLHFLNVRESRRRKANPAKKLLELLAYYLRLIRYAMRTDSRILHILWNNKFEVFDRTILMQYYKMLGKKIALTAHNVNQARRDSKDSPLNRLTLKTQYRLADHIFVHTQKMKSELVEDFRVAEEKITIIPFGINNAVPHTQLTTAEAKRRLGIKPSEGVILFFGRVRPYKGVENLLAAYEQLLTRGSDYRLIIAGEPKKESQDYLNEIQRTVSRIDGAGRVISKIEFIPDADVEKYFKAADVLALPYKEIFQSGVMFLAFSFGLPVIAADVGSFKEEIIENRTGFLCNPSDPVDFANTIEKYFESELYRNLEDHRQDIRDFANARHSWDVVADKTVAVYAELLART
jgi:D-inositol-3-phosphate glycosyltransferase